MTLRNCMRYDCWVYEIKNLIIVWDMITPPWQPFSNFCHGLHRGSIELSNQVGNQKANLPKCDDQIRIVHRPHWPYLPHCELIRIVLTNIFKHFLILQVIWWVFSLFVQEAQQVNWEVGSGLFIYFLVWVSWPVCEWATLTC